MAADNLEEWLLDIRVLDQNPLYLNQIYRLKFRFGPSYPIGGFPPQTTGGANLAGLTP